MNPFLLKTAKTTNMSGGTEHAMLQTLLYELNDGTGYVFALYYIEGRPNGAREHIAIAINDHIDRFRQTTTSGMNIARRFEHMLQAINEELSVLGKDFQRIPLSHLHCAFGVITSNQLYLSGIGDLIVQYMHRTHKSRYTIYDLHRQFEPVEATTWDKIFVTVLDGELHPDDIFYLATPLPTREIAESDIQEILGTLPPAGALKRIEQYAGPQRPYAGICVRVESQEIDLSTKKINPISSLEQFNSTKEETAHILGEPQKNFVSSLQKTLNPFIAKLHQPGERSVASILKQGLRLLLKLFIMLAQFASFVIRTLAPFLKRLWLTISSERTKSGLRGVVSQMGGLATKARAASKRTYIALGIGIFVMFLLFLGLRGLINNGTRKEQVAQIQEISQVVAEKRDQASARLIFNDRATAQTLLTESLSLLDSLPSVRSEAERLSVLRASVVEILNTTRGVITPTVTALATLPEPGLKAIRGGDAISVLSASGAVYKLNTVTNTFDTLANQQSALGALTNIVADEKTTLVMDANKQLGILSGNSSIATIASGVNRLEDVGALGLYNDTLYAVTNNLQQVFKFRRQGADFDGGTIWIISKDSDLSNVRDIAIDGDIYLLNPNAVWRFTSGRQTNFGLAAAEPILQNASDMDIQFEGKNIYVLEPSQKRVLVYDKNGAFISQYVNDDFAQGISIITNETQRSAYVMTSDKLLSFPLTHLVQ